MLLEIDRETGRRGARFRRAEEHLIALTGAEDALVTNNNAAALALAVGLAGRGGVVVSRGELVEIGGGVRIPEIIRRAGAKLIEVGTTNRTTRRRLRGAARRRQGEGGPARPSIELHDDRLHGRPRPGRGRGHRPPARGHRHRRPRIRGAAPDRAVRAGPRADARRAAGGRFGRRDVQRRQAGRWAAGRARRRSRRPHRADAARPARAGDAARQGDAAGRRGDAGPVPGRAGGQPGAGLGHDRDAGRGPARRGPSGWPSGSARRRPSSPSSRRSAAGACRARRSRRSGSR